MVSSRRSGSRIGCPPARRATRVVDSVIRRRRTSGSRRTYPRRSAASKPWASGIVIGRGLRTRWPKVRLPASTSAKRQETISRPRSATSHRTGRAKRTDSGPQRIALGNASPAASAGSTSPSALMVGPPGERRTANTYSPCGVDRRSRPATGTPCARANPSAAWVGRPSAAYATRAAGPRTSRTASSCRSAISSTARTIRRGVDHAATAPQGIRAARSASGAISRICRAAAHAAAAGNSSVPISKTSRGRLCRAGLGGMHAVPKKRPAHLLSPGEVQFRAAPRQGAAPAHQRRPLRDPHRAPRIQQIENVGALQRVLVGRKRQPGVEQPPGFALVGLEELPQRGDIRRLELIHRLLELLLLADLAVGDPGRPDEVEDAVLPLNRLDDPLQAVAQLSGDERNVHAD